MFIDKSNAACNNKTLSSRIICGVSPTTERLYEAAMKIRQIEKPADIARALNVSPQTLTNWEARGMSQQGMLQAEEKIGVRANWLGFFCV